MEFVPTPFRKRDGAGLPLVTPVKRANTAAARPVNVSPQDFDKGSVARSLQGYSLVAIGALSTAQIAEVLKTAARMRELVEKQGGDESLKGRVLASVFYEPSTRTSCSFQAAMLRLGGAVLTVDASGSASAEGEALEDAARSAECSCDALVLLHPRAGAAAVAAAAMNKPLLNAGDGSGEHPSQALLDLYTILDELPGVGAADAASSEVALASALRGRVVTMVGDLKNGRTVHSLAKLLSRFEVTLHFVSPAALRMPGSVTATVRGREHDALTTSILRDTDILYVTRVQKERFDSVDDYDKVKDAFVITPETLSHMKTTARVMHPLPRVGEIDAACDADPRAAYFRQMKNGMYVRMALLRLTVG
mmetsp:Transcript_41120/g.107045  ORF Transcript_41120/g.107045 Transcript_41120/m.107045 type:complete len:364 (+) Transcript_41120:72-1163(+)